MREGATLVGLFSLPAISFQLHNLLTGIADTTYKRGGREGARGSSHLTQERDFKKRAITIQRISLTFIVMRILSRT